MKNYKHDVSGNFILSVMYHVYSVNITRAFRPMLIIPLKSAFFNQLPTDEINCLKCVKPTHCGSQFLLHVQHLNIECSISAC